jgi:hypothetical protein
MAQFELNIYNKETYEIEKKYETDVVLWEVLLKALDFAESPKKLSAREQFEGVNEFVKMIFSGLTDEELNKASVDDVMNTFKQLINKAKAIHGGGNSKNA